MNLRTKVVMHCKSSHTHVLCLQVVGSSVMPKFARQKDQTIEEVRGLAERLQNSHLSSLLCYDSRHGGKVVLSEKKKKSILLQTTVRHGQCPLQNHNIYSISVPANNSPLCLHDTN